MAKTTMLLPIALDMHVAIDGDTDGSPESRLLRGLDDAYNHGELPSDMSWMQPIVADLPRGWEWTQNGAVASGNVLRCGDVAVADGIIHTSGAVPVEVMTAVIARFCAPKE